jgi:PAS domain-containing protein
LWRWATRVTDYTAEDVQALTELGNLLWDILEYKRAQEELAKSEALLNMTQRLSRMGGWQWDVEQQP